MVRLECPLPRRIHQKVAHHARVDAAAAHQFHAARALAALVRVEAGQVCQQGLFVVGIFVAGAQSLSSRFASNCAQSMAASTSLS